MEGRGGYAHINANACRGPKRALYPLELKLYTIVSLLMWVLGPKLRSLKDLSPVVLPAEPFPVPRFYFLVAFTKNVLDKNLWIKLIKYRTFLILVAEHKQSLKIL